MIKPHLLRKLFILTTVFLSFVATADSQDKQFRNLKDYEAGPTFKDYDSHWGGNEPEITRERDTYLWKVWSEKKLAYFTEITYNRHGQATPCIFYVEKGTTDSWQITQECDYLSTCPYVSKKRCQEYRYTKHIYEKIDKIELADGKFTLYWHLKKGN